MFESALTTFTQQRVMILGDVILDEYIFGDVKRISPEAPIPVVDVKRREYRAGGASNVATNIASLGGMPLLCGVVGDDVIAAQLRAVLDQAVMSGECNLVTSDDRPTTLKSRVIAQSQQMLRLDAENRRPIGADVEEAVLAWVRAQIASAHACVLSDYAKGVLTERVCREVIALAAQQGIPVVIDPKGIRYERYAGATVITPNLHEATLAANHPIATSADLETVAAALQGLLGGTSVLITRGEEGMSLFQPHCPPMHIPAKARTVYDVTGAGDTVVSSLALGLAAGLPIEQAIVLANLAASIVVGKLGTAPLTMDELRDVLRAATGLAVSSV